MNRVHGLTPSVAPSSIPSCATSAPLRIVPVGVSVNVAILGTCLAASDLGYQIVLPTDAVVGIPESYAADVMTHTLGLLATLTTVDEIVKVWS